MREIKFRAWDKKEKKMLYSPELSNDLDGAKRWFALLEDESYTASSQDMILQQYTGLKDKNGKEIYEGDIIEKNRPGHCDFHGFRKCSKRRVEVQWLNGVFYPLCQSYYKNNSWEVIGNIYQNKDLLK